MEINIHLKDEVELVDPPVFYNLDDAIEFLESMKEGKEKGVDKSDVKNWKLYIKNDPGKDYEDECEAGSKSGAAKIFFARMPDQWKVEYSPEALEEYIGEE